jgi:DNA-binding LacI/PurR family transcriptional regulator
MTLLKDVAQHAKVSQSTVSRVINNPDLVKSATRNQVYEAMQQLGYKPSAAESRSPKHIIGLAIPEIALDINAEFIREIGKRLDGTPYQLLLFNMKRSRQISSYFIKNVAFHKKIDALIITSATLDRESLDFFKSSKLPVVILQSRCHGEMAIGTNNYLGAHDAVSYLISRDLRKIGIIGHNSEDERLSERFNGYKSALEEAGIEFDPALVASSEVSIQEGYRATAELWQGQKPEAVFYVSDSLAYGGYQYFREQGVRIPEEVSLVGFDDLPMSAIIGLTTMQQFIEEKVEMAVTYLLDTLAGNEPRVPKKEYSISPQLVVRSSTR